MSWIINMNIQQYKQIFASLPVCTICKRQMSVPGSLTQRPLQLEESTVNWAPKFRKIYSIIVIIADSNEPKVQVTRSVQMIEILLKHKQQLKRHQNLLQMLPYHSLLKQPLTLPFPHLSNAQGWECKKGYFKIKIFLIQTSSTDRGRDRARLFWLTKKRYWTRQTREVQRVGKS